MFKVVADQLRVSEGWVRCGQCDEVFDANANIVGDGAAPFASASESSATTTPTPTPIATSAAANALDAGAARDMAFAAHPTGDDARAESTDTGRTGAAPELAGLASGAVAHEVSPALDTFLSMSPSEMAAVDPSGTPSDLRSPREASTDAGRDEPAWAADEITMDGDSPYTMRSAVAEPAESVPVKTPSFMRGAASASRWHKPAVRWALGLLSVVMVATLIAQIAEQERDRLAASIPELRPAIVALCDALGCKVAPFRQIEAIVIDTSAFVPVRGEVYRLNVTLKNKARFDVAVPALELTLTDLQDQTLLRKVFTAADLGSQAGTIAAGAELAAIVPVSVKADTLPQPIRGYRVLAFYP